MEGTEGERKVGEMVDEGRQREVSKLLSVVRNGASAC